MNTGTEKLKSVVKILENYLFEAKNTMLIIFKKLQTMNKLL